MNKYLAMPVYDEAEEKEKEKNAEENENEDSDRLAIVVSREPSRLKYVTFLKIQKTKERRKVTPPSQTLLSASSILITK